MLEQVHAYSIERACSSVLVRVCLFELAKSETLSNARDNESFIERAYVWGGDYWG